VIGLLVVIAAAPLALSAVAVAVLVAMQQTPSQAVLSFPQALLRSSASLAGLNCPIFLSCLLLRNDVAASFFFSFCSMSCWAMSNCCLLFHAVMTHPKLEAEPYEREYGITVYDTELVTLMHDRYYCLILNKLVVVSYLAASLYRLPFFIVIVVVLGISTNAGHIFYSIFSIYRAQFKHGEYSYDIMIS
jgi:hypothetical protein